MNQLLLGTEHALILIREKVIIRSPEHYILIKLQ